MPHLLLLSDTLLDNQTSVAPDRTIIAQVQRLLPRNSQWRAALLPTAHTPIPAVLNHIQSLPADTTHVVLSIGGTYALTALAGIFEVHSSGIAVVQQLYALQMHVEQAYLTVLDTLAERHISTIVCTIAEPNFHNSATQEKMVVGIGVVNDSILRCAFVRGVPVVDSRLICTLPSDYANEIQPSERGSTMIAAAFVAALTMHDFTTPRSAIYR
jgi:hypothetical protein